MALRIQRHLQTLNLTPQKRKERTLQAQLAQVEGLAGRLPVLMVFEDIHWSDPTTRESLDLLVDRVPTLRVLVILTFRPESEDLREVISAYQKCVAETVQRFGGFVAKSRFGRRGDAICAVMLAVVQRVNEFRYHPPPGGTVGKPEPRRSVVRRG